MLVEVIASQSSVVFLRHSVVLMVADQKPHSGDVMVGTE